jgi:glycosyltransferase involved in cell wall biosynthesis
MQNTRKHMEANNKVSHSTSSTTAIVIPAFNEALVIGSVINHIRAHCDFPIFVIDDASTDDTVNEAADAGAIVVPLAVQLGAWGAMQTGMRLARRKGYDVVITMDADGQHDASWLGQLIRPVVEGEADVSIGACTQRGSRLRKIAWLLMKQVSGLTLDDITSGYRAYNSRAILELSGASATLLEYQDVGVLLLLQSRGLVVVDVEVAMQARQNGASRIFRSWLIVFYYMCHTLLLSLTKRGLTDFKHSGRIATQD